MNSNNFYTQKYQNNVYSDRENQVYKVKKIKEELNEEELRNYKIFTDDPPGNSNRENSKQDNSNKYKINQHYKIRHLNPISSNQALENYYRLLEEKEILKSRKSIHRKVNNLSYLNEPDFRNINRSMLDEDKMLNKRLEILERLDKLEEQQVERQKLRNDLKILEERNQAILNLYNKSQNYLKNESLDSIRAKNILKKANNDKDLSYPITIGIKKPIYKKIREKRDYYFNMEPCPKIYRSKFLIDAIKERLNQKLNSRRIASKSLPRIKVYSSLVNPKYPLPIYYPPNSNQSKNLM